MGQRITQVDAFTHTPFGGNPAAICVLPAPAAEHWMQQVAREMNLAETAFLHPEGDGFRLRWFTPAVEVDLCGHATLASAHVLWEEGHLPPAAPARFFTRSGLLTCTRQGTWIEMDFPATPAQPSEAPPELARALGVQPTFVGKSQFDYLIEVRSEEEARAVQPDFFLLQRIPIRGIIVTSRAASPEFDFVSRFFAPQDGIPEDPVTGSAHCCLAPFWHQRLGKTELHAYQASQRGGVLRVRVAGERVVIAGQAITVLRGELLA